jgi:hypothetical protein
MNRREFLIRAAQVPLIGLLAALLPGEVAAAGQNRTLASRTWATAFGRLFKGTSDGEILESLDGGMSWQRAVNFGEGYAVNVLSQEADLLYARVDFASGSFHLKSADGRTWYTLDYIPTGL